MTTSIVPSVAVATMVGATSAVLTPFNSSRSSGQVQLFPIATLPPSFAEPLAGDANHDGHWEFLLTPNAGRVGVFFQENDEGGFDQVARFSAGPTPYVQGDAVFLAMGDVDGDGLTDLFFERPISGCPGCLEYVRMEASTPAGFPDHVVWTYPKEGIGFDWGGFIADTDGDGLPEFIVTDNDSGCAFCVGSSLKVFKSAPNDQMNLIYNNHSFGLGSYIGRPLVADYDGDGKKEIAVMWTGHLRVFESVANDQFVETVDLDTGMVNEGLALIDHGSPDGRPMLICAGSTSTLGNVIEVYESLVNDSMTIVSETPNPANNCYSHTFAATADILGDPTPELVVTDGCGRFKLFSVGAGGTIEYLAGMHLNGLGACALRPQLIPGRPGRIAVDTVDGTIVFAVH
jgi:hypothetical protein